MPYTNDIEGTQTPDSKQETNNMDAKTYEANQNTAYNTLTGRDLIEEVKLQTLGVSFIAGVGAQWTHEATQHETGDMLFTNVNYGGFATARWTSIIVKRQGDGSYKVNRQMKMPAVRQSSKNWTLTHAGFEYRQPNGRA